MASTRFIKPNKHIINMGKTYTVIIEQDEDGKLRETDCADKEGIFRIIQSIPSKNHSNIFQ